MKNEKNKDRIIYGFIFLLFLLILTLVPLAGDDWGNYLVGEKGLKNIIRNTISLYQTWEGRIISRLLINILTFHKLIWNIMNSILITLTIRAIVNIINYKNKLRTQMLVLLSILLMNVYTFSQSITWIAGNITYFVPLSLIIIYLEYIKRTLDRKPKQLEIIIQIIFNIITPLFVEHMAGLLVIINILIIIIKYNKTKKIDKIHLLYILLSIISTLIMVLSPGNLLRSETENLIFNNLNLIKKIKYNIPNFIYYTYIINSFLLCLLTIANLYLVKNEIKTRILKIVMLIYLLVIPFITVIVYNINQFIIVPSFILEIINPNQILVIIYWIGYLILTIYLLVKNKEKRYQNLILIGLGLLCNIIMLLSPTWGYRTSLATYIFLTIPAIETISYINFARILDKMLILFTIFISIILVVFYTNVKMKQLNIEKSIKQQLLEDKTIIEIESFPSFANCNINPMNDYHIQVFKDYYSIPEEKEIILLENNWKYIILR